MASVNEPSRDCGTSSEDEEEMGKLPAALFPPSFVNNACMPRRQPSLVVNNNKPNPAASRAAMGNEKDDSDSDADGDALLPPSLVNNAPMPRRQPSIVNNKPDPEVLKAIMESVYDSDSDADDIALPPPMSMPRRQSLDEMACVLPPCSLVNNAQQPQRQESEDPEVLRAMLMSLRDIGT